MSGHTFTVAVALTATLALSSTGFAQAPPPDGAGIKAYLDLCEKIPIGKLNLQQIETCTLLRRALNGVEEAIEEAHRKKAAAEAVPEKCRKMNACLKITGP